MKAYPSVIAAMLASTLLSFSVAAHEKSTSDSKSNAMQGMDMKGMDMKGDMKGMDMRGHSAASMQLHKIMTDGTHAQMKMTGNVDKDFASMMIMHHKMAVQMADIELKSGANASLKAMAAKMKSDQQLEIQKMSVFTK
jgi:uncharacterized protein (DUF305 family)